MKVEVETKFDVGDVVYTATDQEFRFPLTVMGLDALEFEDREFSFAYYLVNDEANNEAVFSDNELITKPFTLTHEFTPKFKKGDIVHVAPWGSTGRVVDMYVASENDNRAALVYKVYAGSGAGFEFREFDLSPIGSDDA